MRQGGHVGQCVELNPTGFGQPEMCSTKSSKGATGWLELAEGETVRRRVDKRHSAGERTLGLRFSREKCGLWSGFRHGNAEMTLGVVDGPKVHGGKAGLASAGRVARACGSVSDCALEVAPALACLGGEDTHGGEGRSGGEVRQG
jgi:hypothetical protein